VTTAELVSPRQTENWGQPLQAQDPVLTKEYPEARRSQENCSTLPLETMLNTILKFRPVAFCGKPSSFHVDRMNHRVHALGEDRLLPFLACAFIVVIFWVQLGSPSPCSFIFVPLSNFGRHRGSWPAIGTYSSFSSELSSNPIIAAAAILTHLPLVTASLR
jgi:hypothetical protein